MQQSLFIVAGRSITLGEAFVALGALAALLVVFLMLAIWRGQRRQAEAETDRYAEERAVEDRIGELVRLQSEMAGRMNAMAEVLGRRQADLVHGLSERMDMLGHRVGEKLADATRSSHADLSKLNERLAVIDTAQKNLTELSSQVVGLQSILSNKQTRGAFGQGRMEAIVQDGLPRGRYAFQATLSNGNRPDCLIEFPNGTPALVVDAKFPLEAWNAIRAASGPEALRAAETQFRRDITRHVRDIAERYLIPGETQETAFMFVPSESVFSEIHERFEDVVQQAHRTRVVIVSPSLLLLSIQVIQSVLRDAEMREQAHVIQTEVRKLIEDVGRLDDRVLKLQSHFGQAAKDVEDILISTRKVKQRGARIDGLEFREEAVEAAPPLQRDLLAGE
ncbi:MAG TPA: DNA recombination protein RmuC [Kaistia sp.]|nr:DNA recombination protein RmuC [Kaistia sp.]